jgi:L-asparaginase
MEGMPVPESSTTLACRVVVFGMGGTIAMTDSAAGGVVPALSADQLLAAVPGLADTGIAVDVQDFRRVPGACLTFEDLAALAAAIDQHHAWSWP